MERLWSRSYNVRRCRGGYISCRNSNLIGFLDSTEPSTHCRKWTECCQWKFVNEAYTGQHIHWLSAENIIQFAAALQRTSDLDPVFSLKPVFSVRSERYPQVSGLDGLMTRRSILSQQHETLVTTGVLCFSRRTLAWHLGEVSIRSSYRPWGKIVRLTSSMDSLSDERQLSTSVFSQRKSSYLQTFRGGTSSRSVLD